MKKPFNIGLWLGTTLIALMVLSGCTNGNLFGGLSSTGDSGDIRTLNSEASNALRNKDYGRALDLYQRVLVQDPDNSEALYGAAAAAVGSTGINIASLISNITSQVTSSGVTDISSLIQLSKESVSSSATADPASILNGIDQEAVNGIIDLAICRLNLIIAGAADGTIQRNDIDVLLNLGSLCLVRGVLRPLRAGIIDVRNVNGDFDIIYPAGGIGTLCTTHSSLIRQVGSDVVATYALFNRAVEVLNLTGNPIIVQLRSDMDTVVTKLLTPSDPDYIGADCDAVLNAAGITLSGFRSVTTVFNNPGSCS